ncbi:MAG: hypothetical protein JNL17_11100 [Cyclobacteriaceae bacterium]|nr:hypothetical protein [Cyclobacteriaceae bacterium]
MRTPVEDYKGIRFVRISSLPKEQKAIFWSTFEQDKIIKVLRNQELLVDCIPYADYTAWIEKIKARPSNRPVSAAA